MEKGEKRCLDLFAAEIRYHTLEQIGTLGEGHVGGCMSIADLLAVLYGREMQYDAQNPKWDARDRLIISKGHSGPALYSTLALKGFFPVEELKTLNQPETRLPSHCDAHLTPGVDMTTGSLGQGLSAGVGIALANRMDHRNNYVYVIIGDGECQEGQIWEAAMCASHNKLDHLIVFVDKNQAQVDGRVDEICDVGDIDQKFSGFGFCTKHIDGHDVEQISEAIDEVKKVEGVPKVIIMDTVKGKDCSFSQGVGSHYIRVTKEQTEEALALLSGKIKELGC